MKVFHSITALLDDHNIEYVHTHHEATPTSEDSARVRGDKLSMGAKAIVYKIQDSYCLFVFAANQRMDPKRIKTYCKEQGKRAKKTRFASPEELMELTGLVSGSVPPFGKPIFDFDLYVDPSLLENEFISFNAGSLTDSLKMSLADYLEIAKPVVFPFIKHSEIND